VDTSWTSSGDSLAGFGSANWHLLPRLDLTTGLRYTYEWKHAQVARTRYGGDPNASVLAAGDPFLDVLDAALGTNVEQYGFNGIIDDVAGGPYARADSLREGNWSGQAALSYKLAPDVLSYASVARGYKGGGINLGFIGASIKPTFAPEQATSYEIGIKARLFERRLSLAFDIYQADIRNYQALTFDNEMTLLQNPRQINLLNVGQVRLRGAELEGYGYAAPGLMLRAGVALSDAITTEFHSAPDEDNQQNDRDLSGQRLYDAPRWSGNLGAEYGYVSDEPCEPYGAVDWSARTGYYGTVEHGRASYINGSRLLNLRAGLRARDHEWDVSLWMRNALNEKYVATVYPLYGVGDYGAVPGDPRTWGVTLRADLK
ncbi:MAG TPA: TonB-dependent receptor, partial [Nevskiaceae bacterium]|nr:TonB-dependent receptor [Nevskiaceae bacterium]